MISPAYCLKKVSQPSQREMEFKQSPMIFMRREDKVENLGTPWGLEFAEQSTRVKITAKKAPEIYKGFISSLLLKISNCINKEIT